MERWLTFQLPLEAGLVGGLLSSGYLVKSAAGLGRCEQPYLTDAQGWFYAG